MVGFDSFLVFSSEILPALVFCSEFRLLVVVFRHFSIGVEAFSEFSYYFLFLSIFVLCAPSCSNLRGMLEELLGFVRVIRV